MQRPSFFARRAILILVIVFFFVPFALRGARMAVKGMKNDVKDWLPKELAETKDLDEFRRYFLGEQFVLVSWDGCYGDESDERKGNESQREDSIDPHRSAERAAAARDFQEGDETPAQRFEKILNLADPIPPAFSGDLSGSHWIEPMEE